jgi:hypothetical protein
MFKLFKFSNLREVLFDEMLPMMCSMLIVNSFFHLGSFIMEAGIFLTLWYVQSGLLSFVKGAFKNNHKNPRL